MSSHLSSTAQPQNKLSIYEQVERIALNEKELAVRWGLSVKTLRRWRQEELGPVFCKLGRRVTYLLRDIEAFEQQCARFSNHTNMQE